MRMEDSRGGKLHSCISSFHLFSFDLWLLQELSSIIQDLKRVEQQLLGINSVLFLILCACF